MAGRFNLLLVGILCFTTQTLFAGQSLFTPITGGMGCIVEQMNGTEDARFHVQGVSWDGQWLSYTEEYGQTDDGSPIRTIFLLNLESGEKSEFKDTITNSGAFSPDGKFMVGAFEVDSDWKDSYSFWSRDGDYIYFTSERSGTPNIYRIPMEGFGCKKS